jgi:hypothetical protein
MTLQTIRNMPLAAVLMAVAFGAVPAARAAPLELVVIGDTPYTADDEPMMAAATVAIKQMNPPLRVPFWSPPQVRCDQESRPSLKI